MPSSRGPPPPAPSILSRPASSLAAAAAANATSAIPLREGGILRRISQLEVGSPPNNLPASPATSLLSNSSAVAPQQPASPSPAPSAQGKVENKAIGNKSKTADNSQQRQAPLSNGPGAQMEGVTEEDIAKGIDTWDICPYYHVLSANPGTASADLTDGNRPHDLFDNGISTPALLQQAIGNKEAEELGEPDLPMTINCLMNEDISTADEGGDCVEDDEEAEGILSILGATGKGSAANAKKLEKAKAQGQRQVSAQRGFPQGSRQHNSDDARGLNAVDQKGRMELAAFQAEAEATARAEEREAREALWKIEDERNGQVRAMEIERMQAESARYSAEAALRNAEATTVADEHEMNIARRKREEEEAMEDRNIKRTECDPGEDDVVSESAKKDAVEAEKQAYWEITGKEKPF
nr:hypothetical protein I308_05228 [Cryptococcus tetragattii IND107]